MSDRISTTILRGVLCAGCKQPMGSTDGCTDTAYPYVTAGKVKWLKPLPFGKPLEDWGSPEPADARCHDCGVAVGHVHHWGCDWATCPNCEQQLLGCACDMRSEDELEDHK
jgi:hypothetical protein